MSSLASHTIVPTDTGFGRLTLTWGLVRGAAVAVDTIAIMAETRRAMGHRKLSGASTVNVTPSGSGASPREPHLVGGRSRGSGAVHGRAADGTPTRVRAVAPTGASRAPVLWVRTARSRGLPHRPAATRAKIPDGRTSTTSEDLHEHGAARERSSRPPAPRILLYSDDVDAREQVRLAVGRRLRRGAPGHRVGRGRHGRRRRSSQAEAGGLGPADPRRRGRQGRWHGARAASSRTRSTGARRSSCSPVARRTPGSRRGRTPTPSCSRPLDPVELHAAVAALVEASGRHPMTDAPPRRPGPDLFATLVSRQDLDRRADRLGDGRDHERRGVDAARSPRSSSR